MRDPSPFNYGEQHLGERRGSIYDDRGNTPGQRGFLGFECRELRQVAGEAAVYHSAECAGQHLPVGPAAIGGELTGTRRDDGPA
ncbi:hypothetical protein L3i22_028140 [Actinoplanes sp. L3-i22]|nr:hypothetical protein L3i22_028140 [Actinoplanes sp. L3-i22]